MADSRQSADDGVRRALRGMAGVLAARTMMNLSPEERRRCEDRDDGGRRAGDGRAPGKLDLSRSGRISGDDPEPYLAAATQERLQRPARAAPGPDGQGGARRDRLRLGILRLD